MASRCCSSVVKPRLLGQLILATDATQAARNSVAALGICCAAVAVAFLEEAQEDIKTTSKQPVKNKGNLFNIVKYRIKRENF